jgi:glycosyltransferase involved in cell wall biosynthesis
MPDVSVVLVAHDAGRTIRAALASVLAQTVDGCEIVVVDQGSKDDTAAQVRAASDRVRLHRIEGAEVVDAWHAAIQLARGSIIMLLAPTDVWMPRKIERQLRYFAAYPQVGVADADTIDSSSPTAAMHDSADVVPIETPAPPPSAPGLHVPPANRAHVSTIAFRRDALESLGLLQPARVPLTVRDLYTRVAQRYAHGHLNVPLAIRRLPEPPRAGAPADGRTRNLLHDTVYRRTRSAVAAALHALDDAAWSRGRKTRRILFEAASPMSLAVFGPVYRQLVRDPRLEFWFTSCDRSWDAAAIFATAGITERVLDPQRVRYAKFDAYINTDFWDMTWLPRRTRRIHLFHGVAGKYGLDAPVKIAPVVATFDRLMFPNRDRLTRYAQAGLVGLDAPQAALIGYPKVDCLVDGSLDRRATLATIGIDDKRPTVLYAPTWSPYSSLNTMGHQIVAALGRLDVNVIVKLHDRSYDITSRGSGEVDWKRQLRRVCDRHGAHLVQDADASPWLHAADLLITDHSSVGFEFMLLDRPIVVIDSPDLISNARINPEKVRMLQGAAFVVRDHREIARTVRDALGAPGAHSAARQSIAEELFYCPGSATARAVACVYEVLSMPLPDAVNAASRSLAALTPLTRSL